MALRAPFATSRPARLDGSGRLLDNALIESFWSTMQQCSSGSKGSTTRPADTRPLGNLSPVEFEALHNPAATAA